MRPLSLEPRDTPLSLLWYGEPIAAVDVLAARLSYPDPLPAIPAFVALTPWGRVEVESLPADTLAVFVGPAPNPLGFGSPVSYQSDSPLARSPGVSLGLNVPAGFDAVTVASHEFLHGVGVGHTSEGLMSAVLPPGEQRSVTPADIVAIREAGLSYDDSGDPYHTQPFMGGWVMLPLNVAADWIEAGRNGVNSIPPFPA